VFIIDFGLARYVGERDEREETFTGEKKFMREVHYRSDFYALGHFLLFLLYAGYTPDVEEERPWYEELSLSQDGRHVLMRMLQIDKAYQHIEELKKEIRSFLPEEEILCSKNF
jgi:serine/threonine-protein kinase